MSGFDEQQLEGMLRNAPQPRPPCGLKEKLIAQMRAATAKPAQPVVTRSGEGWLRRWWPALVPAGLSLVCAMVMAVQKGELHELKQSVQTLSTNTPPPVPVVVTPKVSEASSPASPEDAQRTEEIARLAEQIAKLSVEVSQLDQMRIENERLRAQLATPPPGQFVAQVRDDMEKARTRAMEIRCVNNLKQMGLAVRVWEGDNNDKFPPDIVCMSNELSTPKILVCPFDTNRTVAVDFPSYTDANCSYEFLAAQGTDAEPNRVMFRCPIDGNICLCDGSVQKGIGKTHPEWLVERDGKLYFEPPLQP
jgi:hypothetical protein